MELQNNVIITHIVDKEDCIEVTAVVTSYQTADGKFVVEPSTVVPKEHWWMKIETNHFKYQIKKSK